MSTIKTATLMVLGLLQEAGAKGIDFEDLYKACGSPQPQEHARRHCLIVNADLNLTPFVTETPKQI